jgi:hypothetical protein
MANSGTALLLLYLCWMRTTIQSLKWKQTAMNSAEWGLLRCILFREGREYILYQVWLFIRSGSNTLPDKDQLILYYTYTHYKLLELARNLHYGKMAFNLHTVTTCLTRKRAVFWTSTLPEGRPYFPSTLFSGRLIGLTLWSRPKIERREKVGG